MKREDTEHLNNMMNTLRLLTKIELRIQQLNAFFSRSQENHSPKLFTCRYKDNSHTYRLSMSYHYNGIKIEISIKI